MPVPTGLPSFLIVPGAIEAVVSVVITVEKHVRRRRSSSAFSHKAPVRLPLVRGVLRAPGARQTAPTSIRVDPREKQRKKGRRREGGENGGL